MNHKYIKQVPKLINWCFIFITPIYVFCMLIYPAFANNFNWTDIQRVWDRWQGLNVGMLALISSMIFFITNAYAIENQRKREFLAASSFLTEALSELNDYLSASASFLNTAMSASYKNTPKNISVPILPVRYREIFEKCIRHATPEVGDHLARILNRIQVLNARITSIKLIPDNSGEYFISETNKRNILVYMYNLGEIECLVNKAYSIGRNKELNLKFPTFQELHDSYNKHNFYNNQTTSNIEMLQDLTKNNIERVNNFFSQNQGD